VEASVGIVKQLGYEPEPLNKAIDKLLSLLGGLDSFIKPGEKVLIKPNLLSARIPDDGVTTHPEIMRAVIRRVKAITDTVIIGDSPGGYGANADEVYEKTGAKRVAEEEGAQLVKFNTSKRVGHYPIAIPVLEADKIISLPKFKTHDVMLITAAVKNMYGIIPGISKARQHSLAPRGKDFAPIIVDVFSIRKPELTLVDAIVGMDRDGPSRGRIRNTNFMIASSDAVAIDSVLMKIVGTKPLDLYTNREAQDRGLGVADLKRIKILGDSIDSVKVSGFEFSQIGFLNKIPASMFWLIKYLINFKVSIDRKKCIKCKLCQESCPADAITINSDKCSVDTPKCLLCLCCREICPHGAIKVNRNWLVRKIWG